MTVRSESNQDLWDSLFQPRRSKRAETQLGARARAGDPAAQWLYAQWLSWDETLGYRPAKGRALTWLTRAAESDHPEALLELGHLVIKRSRKEGMEFYQRAASVGNPYAHWALGLERERDGTKASLRAARLHYAECASSLPFCAWKLGEFELFGIVGTKNTAEALRLFRRAARSGCSPEAETYLGFAAELGIGVKMDLKRAVGWYERASQNSFANSDAGDPIALARLSISLNRLGKDALAHAAAEKSAQGSLPSGMVLLAERFAATPGLETEAQRLFRDAVVAEKDWKISFPHWRAIGDHHSGLMRTAKHYLKSRAGAEH